MIRWRSCISCGDPSYGRHGCLCFFCLRSVVVTGVITAVISAVVAVAF